MGDFVTRASHNHDVIFKVIKKEGNTCYLKGMEVRLIADAHESDLIKLKNEEVKCDDDYAKEVLEKRDLFRSDYFYIPGRILHIDGDSDYLKKCMAFYKKANVLAFGKNISEKDIASEIEKYLEETNPDILVITGHDAYYGRKTESPKYKNSANFIKAVRKARAYEKSNENLIIIAGACQSDYENLIKAGSTFASSPEKINIHALDPAIIAISLSCFEKGKEVDLIDLLSKTKYGAAGIGGIKSKGTMYTGYPRKEE